MQTAQYAVITKAKALVLALESVGLATPRIRPEAQLSPFGRYRPTVQYRDRRLHMTWGPHT